jgi:hypothetical protein
MTYQASLQSSECFAMKSHKNHHKFGMMGEIQPGQGNPDYIKTHHSAPTVHNHAMRDSVQLIIPSCTAELLPGLNPQPSPVLLQ